MKHFLRASYTVYCLFAIPLFGQLNFDEALQKTWVQSPSLRAKLMTIEEREGEFIQSGLYLNPIFSYTVENVMGNRNWKGWESAESRYEISQAILVGGERKYRSNLACFRVQGAQFEYNYFELQTANQLKKAFLEVAARQELLSLAQKQKEVAEGIAGAVILKAENGKASPLEKNKAQSAFVNTNLTLQRASSDLEIAKQKLAQFWGDACPDFDAVDYPFFQIECPPSFEECLSDYEHHPLLISAQFEQLAASEEVKLEKAIAIPNVIVTAGVKTLQNTHDRGAILGIAFPLSIFDRNQGGVSRAKAHSSRRFTEYVDVQMRLEAHLAVLHKDLMRAYYELVQINTIVLPLAEEALTFIQEGCSAGKFECVELLEAQKIFFDAKEQYIRALLAFLEKQTDIEYLTL